jgi:putative tricarboxylic transport membrane protein
MHQDENSTVEPMLVSNRTLEIVVALLFLVAAAIVFYDSNRIGFGWQAEGPAAGFFPFWIAAGLAIASLINLAQALYDRAAGEEAFTTRPAFARVLTVLIPSLAFVALIGGVSLGPVDVPGLGIYVASAIFITGFMLMVGREHPLKALAIGIAVPLVLFMMFERWFLVPLPKGPIESMLGLG